MTVSSVNNLNPIQDANTKNQVLRQKATEFVNQIFYGTMLREFRNAQKPTILDGGPGSSSFIRLLDMELISRMSQRGDSSMADALIKQLGGEVEGTKTFSQGRNVLEGVNNV